MNVKNNNHADKPFGVIFLIREIVVVATM